MANFAPTRPQGIKADGTSGKPSSSATGAQIRFYRMMGDAGGGTSGHFGEWVNVERFQQISLYLYPAGDDQTGDISAAVASVEAAMELDVDNPETETDFQVIATLNAAGPQANITDLWRFIRVTLTTQGAVAAQVGMQGFGV